MRFEELFLIFYNECGLDKGKAQTFLSLFNICINGDPNVDKGNRFGEIDGTTTRFNYQYTKDDNKKDKGYHLEKYKDISRKNIEGHIARFIDTLPDDRRINIDREIKNFVEFYRYDESAEILSIGQGFERLLMTFVKHRSNKVDPGVQKYFPFKTEQEACIAKVASFGNFNSFNLFIVPPAFCLQNNTIKLSRMNSPRVELCVPKLSIKTNEDWMSNLTKLKAPLLFVETNTDYWNEVLRHEDDRFSDADQNAYIGFVTGEPHPINFEEVIVKFKKLVRVKIDDLVANRSVFGINEVNVPNFYFGCSEGTEQHNFEDADGIWMPDEETIVGFAEAVQNGEENVERPSVKIDEFTMYPRACPMWTIKSVNLALALKISDIEIEFL